MALLSEKHQHSVPVSGVRPLQSLAHFADLTSFHGQRCLQPDTKPQMTPRLPSQHATPLQSCTIPSSGAPGGCSLHRPPLTCVFEDPLVGLHHGAEAVEHERPELGSRALGRLVVVQGSVCQNKPALLHLQRGHLVAALNLLMKPA